MSHYIAVICLFKTNFWILFVEYLIKVLVPTQGSLTYCYVILSQQDREVKKTAIDEIITTTDVNRSKAPEASLALSVQKRNPPLGSSKAH